MQKIFLSGCMLLFMAAPAAAYTGMTAEQLRSEIARLHQVADAIRAQLRQLGDDPSRVVAAGTPSVYTGATNPATGSTTGSACLATTVRLERGDRGASVRSLQSFLMASGVYTAGVTGYFGPATEAGVQAWQVQQGIVSFGTPYTTGYGRVGPSTLAAMRRGCSGVAAPTASGSSITPTSPAQLPVERYSLSVNTTRGKAPLNVTASIAINGSNCTSYAIDWGDGSRGFSYDSGRSNECTSLPINLQPTHTYTTPGTYSLSLKNGKGPLSRIESVGQVTIEVID